jgi:cell division protein FtsI (penicillin-binding protein 3)
VRRARGGNPAHRARWLLLLVLLSLVAVTCRLVQLQVVSSGEYAARGLRQRLHTLPIPAERGTIFDRNGNALSMSVRQSTIYADPSLVKDATVTAAKLAPLLGIDAKVLEAKLRQKGEFVYLARKVDDDVASKVKALHLREIGLQDESKRYRPNGDLAMSVLGSVNVDNGGASGIEAQLDAKLSGTPGEMLLERGADGRTTIAGGERRLTPAHPGSDLVLTIDRSLQYEVERGLGDQIVANNAQGGTAIVMEPSTGEILAMANMSMTPQGPRPTSDNRGVTSVFEPGSVNKVITVAGALEEGIVNPDTTYDVPDHLQVSTHRFSDHDPHPVTRWSVRDIVTTSSNIGTIMVAEKLGKDRVDEYLRKFGLGQPTGLGFPHESNGIMKTGRWNGTDIGSIPIGQGIAVNALQMLDVYNTIANGGVFVAPHLVRATVDGEGHEHRVAPAATKRVVSERTAAQVTSMLANVVAVGTGVNAAIPGYTVAGKTGTARKPSLTSRGYEQGAYFATFAGFVPAEAPRLSAIVVLDEPHPYYASLSAAPVFARITKYALRQFRVPPPPAAIETDSTPPPQAPPVAVRD